MMFSIWIVFSAIVDVAFTKTCRLDSLSFERKSYERKKKQSIYGCFIENQSNLCHSPEKQSESAKCNILEKNVSVDRRFHKQITNSIHFLFNKHLFPLKKWWDEKETAATLLFFFSYHRESVMN